MMVAWCLQLDIITFTINSYLLNGKSFFRSQKDLKLNYL